MNVIFLFPYPTGHSPSQRFRFEQYFNLLSEHKIRFTCHSFWDKRTWDILYKKGHYAQKIIGLFKGFLKRILLLAKINEAEFVFIHRECAPIGPPLLEWIITKILSKKVIYDFDDAIWLANTSTENAMVSIVKWHRKIKAICKWSYRISCGNKYLCEFAQRYSKHVTLNPTTIDTENRHNPSLFSINKNNINVITIGWTGTHSTLKYLDSLVVVLQKIEAKYSNVQIVIIANKNPMLPLSSFVFKPWTKKSEIEDLLTFDIGIMPLEDDLWAKGKCGFKALQYMALELPTLASPVGVNCEIIDNGVNGFLCTTEAEWMNCLSKLIEDMETRREVGNTARQKIIKNYSVSSNSLNFLSLFE